MKRGMSSAIAACALILCGSGVCQAQSGWDVSAMGGVFAGHPRASERANQYDNWFNTGQGAVNVGHYFTPHIKVEFEASWTGTGTQFIQRFVTVPGLVAGYPVGAESKSSMRSLGATATWQFFENEWVHPFVMAGASVDVDQRSVHVFEQRYYSGDPRTTTPLIVANESLQGPVRTTRTRALLGGGAKFYVIEHAFIRADGRVTVGAGQYNLAFLVGAGVDF